MTNLHTEFDSPRRSPGFLLWQVNNRWQARQRQTLEPFGITHVQFVLLASLVWLESEHAVTQKELAAHAQTDIMMTSQVLRTLEKKGLVRRQVSDVDRRACQLAPTVQGIRLANTAIVAVEQTDKDFFTQLGFEKDTFTDLLERLAL